MEKIIRALSICDFAALYTEAIGSAPDMISGLDIHKEYALIWDYEKDVLRLLNYAWHDGQRGNTYRLAWEVCIRNPYKQIGAISAHDINARLLPDSLMPYIKQGRNFII